MDWKSTVLSTIKPASEEEKDVYLRIATFLQKLNKMLVDASAILGGSGAKGTWLKGRHEADIFVLFPYEKYKEKSDKLSDILEQWLKGFRFERLHGSRDYFRVREGEFVFEIIPILKIKNARDARNITDVSPLHAGWVKKNSNERLRNDIRLAKAFCKAQGCYGAESYIRGFSGYVLEILVIHYGGFEKLLKAALKWEEKQIVDAGSWYKKKENVWMAVNQAKLYSPLIVIDPVDADRNAAAALDKEKWMLFKEKAKAFLKKPEVKYFEKEEITFEKLKKKGPIVWIEVESLTGKEDKVGAQLLLAFEWMKKQLQEFGVKDAGWEWDRKKSASFWFIVERKERDKVVTVKGPPLEMESHVAAFKKGKKTFVKDGNVWAKVEREDYKLADFVKKKLKESLFAEKVEKITAVKY